MTGRSPIGEIGRETVRVISAASRRHLAAIKALAEVRRLALPAIQVGPNLVAIDARGRAERENNVLS